MAVGRPRVGTLDAARRGAGGAGSPRPRARRRRRRGARRRLCDDVGDLLERVAGAGVDVARLRADDRRPVEPLAGPTEAPRASSAPAPSTATGTTQAVPRPRKRSARSIVVCRSSPTTTWTRRRTDQAALLDVPAGPLEHGVPCRAEGGEVGHLAAGHEAEGDVVRQAEQLGHPGARDLLDHRGRRARRRRAPRSGPRPPTASRPRARRGPRRRSRSRSTARRGSRSPRGRQPRPGVPSPPAGRSVPSPAAARRGTCAARRRLRTVRLAGPGAPRENRPRRTRSRREALVLPSQESTGGRRRDSNLHHKRISACAFRAAAGR